MSTKRYLEKDGPVDKFDEIYNGVSTEHIFADVTDGEVNIQVDFYHPKEHEKFDGEAWEENSCYLTGPPTRDAWRVLWAIARIIQRYGRATAIRSDGTFVNIIPKDGKIYAYNVERRAA